MSDQPAHGDVLITSEGGRHLLSVIPHPHRLTLSQLSAAIQIARKLAETKNAVVWRQADGILTRLPAD